MIDMQKEHFNLIKEEIDCVEDQEADRRITGLRMLGLLESECGQLGPKQGLEQHLEDSQDP